MKRRKSQSILDFAIVFIAVSGLIIGIVRMWVWFNANYAKRQHAYQTSRILAAGSNIPADYNNAVDTAATQECTDCTYHPLELNREWVFGGIPSGTVTGISLEAGGGLNLRACTNSCQTQCLGQTGCGHSSEEFDPSCECYQRCATDCSCDSQTRSAVTAYEKQITNICGSDWASGSDSDCTRCVYNECGTETNTECGQACYLHKTAQTLRDRAEECDDPWELCWWGDWGKTPSELRKAARLLDWNARQLESMARRLMERRSDLQECCALAKDTTIPITGATSVSDTVSSCLKCAKVKAECDNESFQESSEMIQRCESRCGSSPWSNICMSICEKRAESYYDSNYNVCFQKEASCGSDFRLLPCSKRVEVITADIGDQITTMEATIPDMERTRDEATNTVSTCNNRAQDKCEDSCKDRCTKCEQWLCEFDQNCYNECYPPCYEEERNKCCQDNCCAGGEWGRSCDTPTSSCDTECAGQEECPKCGLTKLASNIDLEINNTKTEINRLKSIVPLLQGCCSRATLAEQNECIEDYLSP